ncbi:MAG: hypothetical protein HY071_05630 [Chloroflexi bacterium]|nr:hypothetical protein [Chloroflexota bacterium]
MRYRQRRGRMSLDEQLELEDLLDEAFAPLRGRVPAVSAARVRAAVRWTPAAPPRPRGFGWLLLLGRLAETSLALGLTAFVFIGTFGSAGIRESSNVEARSPAAQIVRPLDQGPRGGAQPRARRVTDDVDAAASLLDDFPTGGDRNLR